MSKDCDKTRKYLPKYVQGHVFKYQQIRISRHLAGCPLCRSEYQALQKITDTRRLLQNVHSGDGIGDHLRAGSAILGRLKVLLYRPLWLIAIAGALTLLYLNVIAPQRRDIEIENIEKQLPPAAPKASAPLPSAAPVTAESVTAQAPAQPGSAAAPGKHAVVEPLVVEITPLNDRAAGRVNELIRGSEQFKKKKFSESVHEISGALSQEEFVEFFGRIEQAAKVTYNRKKALSYPSSQPIPFVMKMKPAPRPAERRPSTQPTDTGVETQTGSQPASAPSPTAP